MNFHDGLLYLVQTATLLMTMAAIYWSLSFTRRKTNRWIGPIAFLYVLALCFMEFHFEGPDGDNIRRLATLSATLFTWAVVVRAQYRIYWLRRLHGINYTRLPNRAERLKILERRRAMESELKQTLNKKLDEAMITGTSDNDGPQGIVNIPDDGYDPDEPYGFINIHEPISEQDAKDLKAKYRDHYEQPFGTVVNTPEVVTQNSIYTTTQKPHPEDKPDNREWVPTSPYDSTYAELCTRPEHKTGPCNGTPRPDCPGFTRWLETVNGE